MFKLRAALPSFFLFFTLMLFALFSLAPIAAAIDADSADTGASADGANTDGTNADAVSNVKTEATIDVGLVAKAQIIPDPVIATRLTSRNVADGSIASAIKRVLDLNSAMQLCGNKADLRKWAEDQANNLKPFACTNVLETSDLCYSAGSVACEPVKDTCDISEDKLLQQCISRQNAQKDNTLSNPEALLTALSERASTYVTERRESCISGENIAESLAPIATEATKNACEGVGNVYKVKNGRAKCFENPNRRQNNGPITVNDDQVEVDQNTEEIQDADSPQEDMPIEENSDSFDGQILDDESESLDRKSKDDQIGDIADIADNKNELNPDDLEFGKEQDEAEPATCPKANIPTCKLGEDLRQGIHPKTQCLIYQCVQVTSPNAITPICAETDNGQNATQPGITTRITSTGRIEKADSCISETSLREYFCTGATISDNVFSCSQCVVSSSGAASCAPASTNIATILPTPVVPSLTVVPAVAVTSPSTPVVCPTTCASACTSGKVCKSTSINRVTKCPVYTCQFPTSIRPAVPTSVVCPITCASACTLGKVCTKASKVDPVTQCSVYSCQLPNLVTARRTTSGGSARSIVPITVKIVAIPSKLNEFVSEPPEQSEESNAPAVDSPACDSQEIKRDVEAGVLAKVYASYAPEQIDKICKKEAKNIHVLKKLCKTPETAHAECTAQIEKACSVVGSALDSCKQVSSDKTQLADQIYAYVDARCEVGTIVGSDTLNELSKILPEQTAAVLDAESSNIAKAAVSIEKTIKPKDTFYELQRIICLKDGEEQASAKQCFDQLKAFEKTISILSALQVSPDEKAKITVASDTLKTQLQVLTNKCVEKAKNAGGLCSIARS